MRVAGVLVALVALVAAAGLAGANDVDRTPEDRQRAREARRGTPGYGAPRPAGSLLLNMLIKNEREHLDRTLPHWAKVIDAWVIGVDDKNTDDSVAVIHKHLGHIPGRVEVVSFDGMGPTWTKLVDVGVREHPNVTHGIIADADFRPMVDHLDKRELDIRCAKHMYTIWTEDHSSERKMDWIYRNIPGAKVKRRTHQTVEVPPFPHQEVMQTLINLPIEERTGGYQDRTPGKNSRYVGFLEADLADFPEDPRSLYYLGYAHFDMYRSARAQDRLDEEARENLRTAVAYMERRVAAEGNEEEKWFTILKLGEIEERYHGNWAAAERRYLNCTVLDPDRADPWFYLGQHYRLHNDHEAAYPYLLKAASLPTPDRSLFQWHSLYNCLAAVELGRSQAAGSAASTPSRLRSTLALLRDARCAGQGSAVQNERTSLEKSLAKALKKSKKKKKNKKNKKNKKKKGKAAEEEEEDDSAAERGGVAMSESRADIAAHAKRQSKRVARLLAGVSTSRAASGPSGALDPTGAPLTVGAAAKAVLRELRSFALAVPAGTTCADYRRATAPYLRFFRRHAEALVAVAEEADDDAAHDLEDANTELRTFCR